MNSDLKSLVLNILETKENVLFNIVFDLYQECVEFDNEDFYCVISGRGKFYYGSECNIRIKFTQEAFTHLIQLNPESKKEFEEINEIANANWKECQIKGLYYLFGDFESSLVIKNLVFVLIYNFESEDYNCIAIQTKKAFYDLLEPHINELVDYFDLELIRVT